MEPMRVLIVDDEHFAVHSLCLLLSNYPSLVVLPSSGNGVKALEQLWLSSCLYTLISLAVIVMCKKL